MADHADAPDTDSRHTDARTADPDLPRLRIRGVADFVPVVPYLLGFHPQNSLVVIGLANARVVVTARMDLADLRYPEIVEHTVASMARGGAERFVGVVFDDAPLTQGQPLPWTAAAADLAARVRAEGCALDEVLLAAGAHVCSLTHGSGVGPDGSEPRQVDRAGEIAAAATYAGLVALPDRAAVAALLEPDPEAGREGVRACIVQRQRRRVKRPAPAFGSSADEPADDPVNEPTVRELCALASESTGAPSLSDDQVARFGLALRSIPTRDALWLAVDNEQIDGRELWRLLARRLPAPFDAAPLFLFGWGTWRHGGGALAGMAAERALESDPRYSAADLLLAALNQAIDPRTWPKLSMPRAAC